jgi:hypothetical protein
MVDSRNEILKQVRQRRFLNKDFTSLRVDLLDYARSFYSDRIQDFSESSLGGVLLDFAAFVGDVQSFYLDHQFGELFAETAVENANIERSLREAGVDIVGASPSVANVFFFIEVPARLVGTEVVPDPDALPIIEQDTIITADNGIQFFLTEDIDFSSVDEQGNLVAAIQVSTLNATGAPSSFIMSLPGICISGQLTTENFRIPATFIPFRELTLANPDVTEIVSVTDTLGNRYFEVDGLTQDTVFRRIPNPNSDSMLVDEALEVVPAPYRYTTRTGITSRQTTLTLGGGNAQTLDDDIIPDPSEFALPLFGKKTFSRFTLDPNRLLQTRTLGVSATDVTLSVIYRHGGGLSHNVPSNSIVNVTGLTMRFPNNPPTNISARIRATVEATNTQPASGGESAPNLDELRQQIPSARNAQGRIVTREDLLARVYTMPSNFGRVFRAGIRSNPNNPLASQLFIISRNSRQQLITSPDTLKLNLSRFLNEFRLISDAIDILDARVINLGIDYEIVVDPTFNKKIVIQNVNRRLRNYANVRNFQIDQPIVLSDIVNIIYNNPGIIAVNDVTVKNISGVFQNRTYSVEPFDVRSNTVKNMIVGPPGSIFEFRFPNFDIQGAAI